MFKVQRIDIIGFRDIICCQQEADAMNRKSELEQMYGKQFRIIQE